MTRSSRRRPDSRTTRSKSARDRRAEEPAPKLPPPSPEAPTISAILADVSPGGRTATGLLPGRAGENWLPEAGPRNPQSAHGGDRPSSRNPRIGWSGPPVPRTAGSYLPEDWNAIESDYGSVLEHYPATNTVVHLSGRRPDTAARAEKRSAEEAGTGAPAAKQSTEKKKPRRKKAAAPKASGGAGEDAAPPGEAAPSPGLPRAGTSEPMDRLERKLRALEEIMADLLSRYGADPAHAPADPPRPSESASDEVLLRRLDALMESHLALQAAIDRLTGELSRKIDPRVIEARIDAKRPKLPWLAERAYWQAFKANFEKDGQNVTVTDLFREALCTHADAPQEQRLGPDAPNKTRQDG